MARKRIVDLSALATAALTYVVEIHRPGQTSSEKITVEDLLEPEATTRENNDDAIITGIGANADGTYNAPSGTNYLDGSTDIMDALGILDNAIGGTTVVLEKNLILEPSDITSLNSHPIDVIAAPGSTYYIEIISASAVLNYDSDPYAIAAGGKLVLQYDGAGSHLVEWSETFIEGTSDTINRGVFTSNVAMVANTKIVVTATEAITPDGNDDGDIRLNILYAIHNIATEGAGSP